MKHLQIAICATLAIALSATRQAVASPVLKLCRGHAATDGAFLTCNATIPESASSVNATWEEDSLVVEIATELRNGETPIAKGSQKNPTSIFQGNTIELFLAPHQDKPEVYYQFAVNPSNVLYQAKGPDVSWLPNAKVTTSVAVSNDFWKAVFTVPFGAFGEAMPDIGCEWGANFACGGANWSGIGDLHSPLSFGHILFGSESAEIAITKLNYAGSTLSATFEKVAGVAANVRIADQSYDFPSDQTQLSLSKKIALSGTALPHKLLEQIDIKATLDNGNTLSLCAFSGEGDPEWLVIDRFFYQATNELAISYSAKEFHNPTVSITDISTSQRVFSVKGKDNGTVTICGIDVGQYEFSVEEEGKTASCEFRVTRACPQRKTCSAIELNASHPTVLYACDESKSPKPIFPVVGDGLTSALAVKSCLSYGFTREPTTGFLFDESLAHRHYCDNNLLGDAKQNRSVIHRLGYEAQMAVMLKSTNGTVRIHPNGASFFADIYKALKALYPESVFSIQIDSQVNPREFAAACDVFETAFWDSSYAASLMAKLPGDIAAMRDLAGWKPTLLWLGGSIPNGRIRTADELDAAIHLCILREISGAVIHLGHGGVPKSRTRVWSFLIGIEAEIASWYPRWIDGIPIDINGAGDGIEFAARELPDGETMILAVNTRPTCSTFSYKLGNDLRKITLPGYGTYLNSRTR